MEERKSNVAWSESHRGKGNAHAETETKLRELLNEIGEAIELEAANDAKLDLNWFPIFRRFEVFGVVTHDNVFYFVSPFVGGFLPKVIWCDIRQEQDPPTQNQIRKYLEVEFGWDPALTWTVELDSKLLECQPHERKDEIQKVARNVANEMIEKKDKEARIVKINPIFRGRGFFFQEDLCFVLLPLKDPFLTIYKDHIKPIFETLGFTVMNADDIKRSSIIIQDIWEYINKSCLIVADVTGKNENVFYELGIAHTIGKPYIILTQNREDVPFDIKHLRYFLYADKEDSWRDLRMNLERVVREIVP